MGNTNLKDHPATTEETFVLAALQTHPLFATEVAPNENRSPGEPRPISDALDRCLNEGWVRTGHANSCDWRMHLSDTGRVELARRRARVRRGRPVRG
jgi:hypothetical protein